MGSGFRQLPGDQINNGPFMELGGSAEERKEEIYDLAGEGSRSACIGGLSSSCLLRIDPSNPVHIP